MNENANREQTPSIARRIEELRGELAAGERRLAELDAERPRLRDTIATHRRRDHGTDGTPRRSRLSAMPAEFRRPTPMTTLVVADACLGNTSATRTQSTPP